MFDHYLITRFNLKNPDWEFTKRNEALLNDAWMEERMWLFSNFCFPSVAAQSTKNFTWLLYFDVTTPDKYRQQIEDLLKGHNNIKAYYINGMPEFYNAVESTISGSATGNEYLITSRIDNDDAIHKDFITEVQKAFNRQEYCAVDVIKGYSLQVKPTVMLGKKEHIFNPFISLIEKLQLGEKPKTVWFNDHQMWKKETRVKQLTHKRLWMAVIHEKNKINNFNGYDNVSWDKLQQEFILSPEITKWIAENLVPHRQWLKLSIKNKVIVKYKVLSKSFKKMLGVYKFKKL